MHIMILRERTRLPERRSRKGVPMVEKMVSGHAITGNINGYSIMSLHEKTTNQISGKGNQLLEEKKLNIENCSAL